jgi:hypothetical protein
VQGAELRRPASPPCAREAELLDALQTSAWPDCCPRDLRDHVAACASCAELEAIVRPLLDEHHLAVSSASVPPSGAVWWRAQMRARQEAAQRAARPVSIAQAIGVACAVGVLAGGLTLLAPMLGDWFGWTAGLAGTLPSVTWSEIQWLAPATMAVMLALTMVFVLAPVAVYLAVKE